MSNIPTTVTTAPRTLTHAQDTADAVPTITATEWAGDAPAVTAAALRAYFAEWAAVDRNGDWGDLTFREAWMSGDGVVVDDVDDDDLAAWPVLVAEDVNDPTFRRMYWAARSATPVTVPPTVDLPLADDDGALLYVIDEEEWHDVDGVDVDDVDACPACGEPVDYCQGHGAIGDPHGANVLDMHEAGEHIECHPAGCDVADDVRRQAYGA